jgi:hypothetical protein
MTTIRHSDTIAPMAESDAHAAILRMAALRAVADARAAWRDARTTPSEESIRAALRACALAARTLRRASAENPDEEQEMLDRAALLDESSVGLKRRLVRLVEQARPQ